MTSEAELIPASPKAIAPQSPTVVRAVRPAPRWSRRRGVMSTFALFAVAGFAAAYLGPLGATGSRADAVELDPVSLYASTIDDAQSYLAASAETEGLGRDDLLYTVYVKPKPKPTPTATGAAASSSGASWKPPFVTPNPGSAQAIANDMVQARGWGDDEVACLVALWKKESGWRVNAYNKSSGAYGIPQALPGKKMAKAGADWETNPATQIAWGLGYIKGRYGTPCGAWSHSQRVGWY